MESYSSLGSKGPLEVTLYTPIQSPLEIRFNFKTKSSFSRTYLILDKIALKAEIPQPHVCSMIITIDLSAVSLLKVTVIVQSMGCSLWRTQLI